MVKGYKITFKAYYNERLNKVDFHGEQTYPLYIQITYRRKTIIFKSYFFYLLSKPRYKIGGGLRIKTPSLSEVIEKENAVLNFLIEDWPRDFTVDHFKSLYDIYSKDLCTLTEEDFRLYMFVFFKMRKMSTLAYVLSNIKVDYVLYDLLKDMATSIEPGLHKALLEGAVSHGKFAALYLPLYGFIKSSRPAHLKILSLYEWADTKVQQALLKYLSDNHPEWETQKIFNLISVRIEDLANKTQTLT